MIQSALNMSLLLLTRPIFRRISMQYLPGQNYHNWILTYPNVLIFLLSLSSFLHNLSDTAISSSNFQKDAGLIVSNNLSWLNHYNHIISRTYKMLGLIRQLFSSSLHSSVKMKLYFTLVPNILPPIWHPSLLKDIQNIERI